NVRSFKAALDNARLTSERLPGAVRDVQQMVVDVRSASQEVQGAAADLRGVEARTAPDIESAIANLAKTSAVLERFVADNEPGLTRFTHQSLPEFERLLRESRGAAQDIRDLSRSLKQNPSQLIYEPNYRGVEVAK